MVLTTGAVLSTVNVVEGDEAAALLPARSVAVPAPIVKPRLPVPVILEIVTVYDVPEPLTATVPLALPVLFSVILPVPSELLLKLASE